MIFYKIFFLLIAIFSSKAMAKELSQCNVDFGTMNTADQIQQNQLHLEYRNHRRDIFYPYNNESESSWDFGVKADASDGEVSQFQFSSYGFQLLAGRKVSKTVNIESTLGLKSVKDKKTNASKEVFSGSVIGQAIFSKKYSGSLEVGTDMANGSYIQLGDLSTQFTSTFIKPNFNIRWSQKWRSQIKYQQHYLSDDNSKSQVDLSTSYGLATGVQWVWVGLGVENLTFSKTSSNYWSPSSFLSLGPRLEVAVPVYKKFSASSGLNLNRLYDRDSDTWGSGLYFSGKIQYGNRNELNTSLYVIQIESIQNGNKWSSTQSGLTLSFPF